MLEAAPSSPGSLRSPVRPRLDAVRERIVDMVADGYAAVDEVSGYLAGLEGKLVRPTLLLLANEVGDSPDERAVDLAAIVELVHVATLVHDDAVDHSVRRRGMPTVNARWTHQVAIIMGDFLYSRALTELARLGDVEAVEILGDAANRMTVGEMRQLMAHDALDADEEDYELLCECKTASLMAAACELGALVGRPELRAPLKAYGYELGMAFQVTDDLLDYTASSRVIGKPSGQDLREHKVTLPLIAALPALDAEERARVDGLFADPEPGDELVAEVIGIVDRRGGLDYARDRARFWAERAAGRLEDLPGGPATEALGQAVDFVVTRRS
jgi:octaprenyl-diphosphate synthase